ncbi:MAG TPA: hypothetical protein VGK29_27580 [Paludibaculum sp.]|jgi:hypothetical protein
MKTTILLSSLFSLCCSAQVGLGLSPMRLDLSLQPGSSHSGALDLTNEVGSTARVRGELLDFQIDETTTPQFLRQIPGEAANSCREWLTANPMETEVTSSQHLIVRFTIQVPKTATPRSYYCGIGYTTLPTAEKLKTTGFRSAVRIVAAIYVIVGTPKPEGEVSGLFYEPVPGSKDNMWRVVLVVRNRSDYHFRPSGTVELLSGSGATMELIQIPSFPTLPRREQRYVLPVTLPNPSDVRKLNAKVDLGNHEIQEASIDVAQLAALR